MNLFATDARKTEIVDDLAVAAMAVQQQGLVRGPAAKAAPEKTTLTAPKKRKAEAVEVKSEVKKPVKRPKQDDAGSPRLSLYQRNLQPRKAAQVQKSRQGKETAIKDPEETVKEATTSRTGSEATRKHSPATPQVIVTSNRPALAEKDAQAPSRKICIASTSAPPKDVQKQQQQPPKVAVDTAQTMLKSNSPANNPQRRIFLKPKIKTSSQTPTKIKAPIKDPQEPPFFKAGVHDPCLSRGDFANDHDDLVTGRGHQITPKHHDQLRYYYEVQQEMHTKYSRWPKVPEGEIVEEDLVDTWLCCERWYKAFHDQYKGYAVNHLWDCGCPKPRDDDESEEE